MSISKTALIATSVAALMVSVSAASAGGFAVREQGALAQGSSFAGAGASGSLSSMFQNSAAAASLTGTNAEQGISWISPEGNLTATTGSTRLNGATWSNSTDIGRDAYVPSAYLNHQFKAEPKLSIGLGVNSAFGLKTEPDKRWSGSEVGGATSLFTTAFNPVLAYKFSDTFAVGVGASFEYAKGTFKFATGSPTGPNSFFTGDNIAVGATAGLMYTPNAGTRIGLGWRSQITHDLDGRFASTASPIPAALFGPAAVPINAALNAGVASKVELRLPDIINLSVNHAVSSNARVLATVEWTNWSRFGGLEVTTTAAGNSVLSVSGTNPFGAVKAGQSVGRISGNWEDGWFFSGGLEYDVSPALTVRAGGAYEISPITKASERIVGIPDADRIWASVGFSYAVNATTNLDFGYSHVFVEDAKVDRTNIRGDVRLLADLEGSADIISLGVRMKLGQ
jgi:long-chain fatty acid transport protein